MSFRARTIIAERRTRNAAIVTITSRSAKGAPEAVALGILRRHLLTDEHAKLFVEEYKREIKRLKEAGSQDVSAHASG